MAADVGGVSRRVMNSVLQQREKKTLLEDLMGARQNNTPDQHSGGVEMPPAPAHISPAERAARRGGPVMNYTKADSLWEIWTGQEG